MKLGQRSLFKHQIVITDTATGKVVDRYYVKSPVDMPRQCTDSETVTYMTSWWHLFWETLATGPARRFQRSRSTKQGELWDDRRRTRVADIIHQPYVVTQIELELHVHHDHLVLYQITSTGKVQIPLFSLDRCLSALVKSSLSKQEVIDKVKGQPYELCADDPV